jgi:hypothetical protein
MAGNPSYAEASAGNPSYAEASAGNPSYAEASAGKSTSVFIQLIPFHFLPVFFMNREHAE